MPMYIIIFINFHGMSYKLTCPVFHGFCHAIVAMQCSHGMLPWNVGMEYFQTVLQYVFNTMECYHGVSLWSVANDYYELLPWHGVLPYIVNMECFQRVLPWTQVKS